MRNNRLHIQVSRYTHTTPSRIQEIHFEEDLVLSYQRSEEVDFLDGKIAAILDSPEDDE